MSQISIYFISIYLFFIFILCYFIPYVTMLSGSLYGDKEVLFKFPSAHSVWRATSVFNMYLKGGGSSEFTSGIFCFEASQINNTFLIKKLYQSSHRSL